MSGAHGDSQPPAAAALPHSHSGIQDHHVRHVVDSSPEVSPEDHSVPLRHTYYALRHGQSL